MAFNLLSIGTDGYLCKDSDRNVLAIATTGYIGCGAVAPPVDPPAIDKPLSQPGTGSGWQGAHDYVDIGEKIKLDLKDPRKKKINNDAILAVIKAFVQCQEEDYLQN